MDKPTYTKHLINIVKAIGDGSQWWNGLNQQQQARFIDEAWALHLSACGPTEPSTKVGAFLTRVFGRAKVLIR